MKTYDVKIEGRTYRVEVEEVTGTGAAARGKSPAVAVSGGARSCGSKGASATATGTSSAASVVTAGSAVAASKTGATAAAETTASTVARTAVTAAGGAREDIEAPMPGTILRVYARDGQEVKAGDVILVLEAMKMENEITASRSGKLTGLAVVEGQQVAAGQLLAAVC